jgi:hypothetical protein
MSFFKYESIFNAPEYIAINGYFQNQKKVQETLDVFLEKHKNILAIFSNQISEYFVSILDKNEIDNEVLENLHPIFSESYKPFNTPKDGNCLWHMLSISICGSTGLSVLLRNMTVITLAKLREKFMKIIELDFTLRNRNAKNSEKIVYSKKKYFSLLRTAKTIGEWGNEFHLLAAATFLGADIYIYGYFNKKKMTEQELCLSFINFKSDIGIHLIYKPIENEFFKSKRLTGNILYGHFDQKRSHYSALIPQSKNALQFKPLTNLFDFS